MFGATSVIATTAVGAFVFFDADDDALSDSEVIVTIFVVAANSVQCENNKI